MFIMCPRENCQISDSFPRTILVFPGIPKSVNRKAKYTQPESTSSLIVTKPHPKNLTLRGPHKTLYFLNMVLSGLLETWQQWNCICEIQNTIIFTWYFGIDQCLSHWSPPCPVIPVKFIYGLHNFQSFRIIILRKFGKDVIVLFQHWHHICYCFYCFLFGDLLLCSHCKQTRSSH